MNRRDLIGALGSAGVIGAAASLPSKLSAQIPAASSQPNSINTATANYFHELRWANAPHYMDYFKPSGTLKTHAGQLITNASHSFHAKAVNVSKKLYTVTHSHTFSNQNAVRNWTDTTPWLMEPGSFRNSFGHTITVKAPGYATIAFNRDNASWLFTAKQQKGQFSVETNLESTKGYNYTHLYTANASSIFGGGGAAVAASPDQMVPDVVMGIEPYGATGVVMGIAAGIFGFALGPEIAFGIGVISAGYGIYGVGIASGWWGGSGGGGGGYQDAPYCL